MLPNDDICVLADPSQVYHVVPLSKENANRMVHKDGTVAVIYAVLIADTVSSNNIFDPMAFENK
jgi:hypothetical protein